MKVLNTSQIREADQFTIINEPISSLDLMERAARRCFNFITFDYPYDLFAIFCGIGNNGGDGLVIARLLAQRGKFTEVYIVHFSESCSPDFSTNLERLSKMDNVRIIHLTEAKHEFVLGKELVVIDAMFGSGLSKPVRGFTAEIIQRINALPNEVIAIDSPSGLYNDMPTEEGAVIVEASRTYTFQFPKRSHFCPENFKYVGRWSVVEIGLHPTFIENAPASYFWSTRTEMKRLLRKRGAFDHKGTFGHALLVAGSHGKMGAAQLVTKSCLRSGTGLVTVHIPRCGLEIIQESIPEAMCMVDPNENVISQVDGSLESFEAVGIGPGIGKDVKTLEALRQLCIKVKRPMVLDADAINLISENHSLMDLVPKHSVFTPHLKEFERLTGSCTNHFERMEKLEKLCVEREWTIVLKGQYTIVGCPDGSLHFNSTGNPGMATGGSGDVLTGIITGLLAQGYAPEESAILGVYLHGLAGDLALKHESEQSMIASDITNHLGQAFWLLASESVKN